MKILNLTQHIATAEQTVAGVYEPSSKSEVQKLLTFSELPSSEEIKDRAKEIASIAKKDGASHAMIGGAPFFMSSLERALREIDVTPLYAFSIREIVEEKDKDGAVIKTAVFKHKGFVAVP